MERDFESFRVASGDGHHRGGRSARADALFTGISSSSRLEGELVVATSGGTGVVMLAIAPEGQLARVQGDLDTMLGNLVVPR